LEISFGASEDRRELLRSVARMVSALGRRDGQPAHCDDAEVRVAVIRSVAWAMFVPR
jgi:hypothetical protein